MKTKLFEATSEGALWGKFLVGRMDTEWDYVSKIDHRGLVRGRGWARQHLWVLDLQTGEGAIFWPGGHPALDLQKKRIWVCPCFEGFLGWLYRQDLTDLDALPAVVEIPGGQTTASYRRPGPAEAAE